MSGFFGTQDEALYAYFGAATTSTPTTTPGSSMIIGYPAVVIPGGIMGSVGSRSTSLQLKMGGLLTATATIPTWQFFLYLTTSNAFGTTLTLGSTATFTPTAQTNAPWFCDINIGLRTLALGGASTVIAMGSFRSAGFPTATFGEVSMPATGAYTPLATWASDQQYFLWPALSLGAATAGNTVTTEYVKLFGED